MADVWRVRKERYISAAWGRVMTDRSGSLPGNGLETTEEASDHTFGTLIDQNRQIIDLLTKLQVRDSSGSAQTQTLDNPPVVLVGDTHSSQPHRANTTQGGPGATQGASAALPTGANVTLDLQHAWQNIKDKYAAVTLPEDHRLHESRADIRREDQRTLNVLTKCGRYSEVALKILQKIDNSAGDTDLTPYLTDLYTCLLAHIRYLNDEFAVLFVNSNTNQATAKIFRALRKNTSAFSQDVIADLRSAASVVAAGVSQNTPPSRGRFAHREFRGSRWPSHRGDRGRGYRWQQSNDMYSSYLGRNNIPNARAPDNSTSGGQGQ